MLKIMEDKMEHENDKWLEQQLRAKPQFSDDGFNKRVMAEVDELREKKWQTRKIVLQLSYFVSFILFLTITPWNWLFDKINNTQGQMVDLMSSDTSAPFPLMAFSIVLVVSLTFFVFGQEES